MGGALARPRISREILSIITVLNKSCNSKTADPLGIEPSQSALGGHAHWPTDSPNLGTLGPNQENETRLSASLCNGQGHHATDNWGAEYHVYAEDSPLGAGHRIGVAGFRKSQCIRRFPCLSGASPVGTREDLTVMAQSDSSPPATDHTTM